MSVITEADKFQHDQVVTFAEKVINLVAKAATFAPSLIPQPLKISVTRSPWRLEVASLMFKAGIYQPTNG